LVQRGAKQVHGKKMNSGGGGGKTLSQNQKKKDFWVFAIQGEERQKQKKKYKSLGR